MAKQDLRSIIERELMDSGVDLSDKLSIDSYLSPPMDSRRRVDPFAGEYDGYDDLGLPLERSVYELFYLLPEGHSDEDEEECQLASH
jgi:hypothetical protein